MSASPSDNILPAAPYATANIPTLLGRAWNLSRLNWKACLTILPVPILMSFITATLFSLPSALSPLQKTAPTHIALIIGAFFLGLVFSVLSLYVTILSATVLIRIFYSSLVQAEPITLKESLGHLKKIWPKTIFFLGYMLLFSIIFAAADLLVFLVGFYGIILLTTSLAFVGKYLNASIPAGLAIAGGILILMVAVGFIALTLLGGLISLQVLLVSLPLVSLTLLDRSPLSPQSSNNPLASFFSLTGYSLKLMFSSLNSLSKTALFGLLFFVLIYVLQAPFILPAYVWAGFEYGRTGGLESGMPFHVSTILNLWFSLLHGFYLIYFYAVLTLFWYDRRISLEALDLRFALNRLHRKQPTP